MSALALAATAHNCATTDGSFSIGDSAARPSLYCRATDLYPPALNSVHGLVVCVLLFATPFVSVVVTRVHDGALALRGRRLPPVLLS